MAKLLNALADALGGIGDERRNSGTGTFAGSWGKAMSPLLKMLLVAMLLAALPKASEASLVTFQLNGGARCQDPWIESDGRNCESLSAQSGIPQVPPIVDSWHVPLEMKFTLDTSATATHVDTGDRGTSNIDIYTFNQPGTEFKLTIGNYTYQTSSFSLALYKQGGLGEYACGLSTEDKLEIATGDYIGGFGSGFPGFSRKGVQLTMASCG